MNIHCPPGDCESTCNLVELCDQQQNKCFSATSCGTHNGPVMAQYCDSAKCIITPDNIPLQPCNSKNCVAIESIEPDYVCPPPPNCPMNYRMCPGSFTPVNDDGCVSGCPQCPVIELAPSPPRDDRKSPSPPPPSPPPPSPPPSLPPSPPPSLPPSPPPHREDTKTPSPPPPKEDTKTPSPPPPREDRKSPSPPPPREDRKSPSPPPPREDRKSPSPPPPREDRKSPSPPPPREDRKSPSPPPPREDRKSPSPPPPKLMGTPESPSPPPPREDRKFPSPPPPKLMGTPESPSPPPPREDRKSPSPPPPKEDTKTPSPPPPREDRKSPSPPPPREDRKSPSPPPPKEDTKTPSPPPPREDRKSPSPPPPKEDTKTPSPPPSAPVGVNSSEIIPCMMFMCPEVKCSNSIRPLVDADGCVLGCATCPSPVPEILESDIISRVQRVGVKWSRDPINNREVLSNPMKFADIMTDLSRGVSKILSQNDNIIHTEMLGVALQYKKYSDRVALDETVRCMDRPWLDAVMLQHPVDT